MRTKRFFCRLVALLVCATLVTTTAAAASSETQGDAPPAPIPATTRVWGTLTKQENGSVRLQNSGEMDGVLNDVILRIHEDTLILNAVDGTPMALADLREGEMVYAYAGNAMTRSMPPQAAAVVILGRIPADFAVPTYYEVTDFSMIGTMMVENNLITATVRTDRGEELRFSLTDKLDEAGLRQYILKDDVTFRAYGSKSGAAVTDLTPGTRILVWNDMAGKPREILVFPYGYLGYAEVTETGVISLNGNLLDAPAILENGMQYLPIRAVCEALGLTVAWNGAAKTITVTHNGDGAAPDAENAVVFTYTAGAKTALAGGEEITLTAPSVSVGRAAHLPAADLARMLNLYLAPSNANAITVG